MDRVNVALRCIPAPQKQQTNPNPLPPSKKKQQLKTTTTKQTNLHSNNFLCRSAMGWFHIALCCIVTGINNAIDVAMLYGYPILIP